MEKLQAEHRTVANKMMTIKVTNIHQGVTEKETRDFFQFCGKIRSLKLEKGSSGNTQAAEIHFEREAAAKTALLLDNTKLGQEQIKVEMAGGSSSAGRSTNGNGASGDELMQEDKPRAAIFAEILSHGYVISDSALERGIEVDKKHGISQRFYDILNSALQTAKSLDEKYHVQDRVTKADETYKVSDQAKSRFEKLQQYFQSALGTPTGQRVRDFYTSAQKQVLDIHNEARRLADERQGKDGKEGASKEQSSTTPSEKAHA